MGEKRQEGFTLTASLAQPPRQAARWGPPPAAADWHVSSAVGARPCHLVTLLHGCLRSSSKTPCQPPLSPGHRDCSHPHVSCLFHHYSVLGWVRKGLTAGLKCMMCRRTDLGVTPRPTGNGWGWRMHEKYAFDW